MKDSLILSTQILILRKAVVIIHWLSYNCSNSPYNIVLLYAYSLHLQDTPLFIPHLDPKHSTTWIVIAANMIVLS